MIVKNFGLCDNHITTDTALNCRKTSSAFQNMVNSGDSGGKP